MEAHMPVQVVLWGLGTLVLILLTLVNPLFLIPAIFVARKFTVEIDAWRDEDEDSSPPKDTHIPI
jgi:hypothetical protein